MKQDAPKTNTTSSKVANNEGKGQKASNKQVKPEKQGGKGRAESSRRDSRRGARQASGNTGSSPPQGNSAAMQAPEIDSRIKVQDILQESSSPQQVRADRWMTSEFFCQNLG